MKSQDEVTRAHDLMVGILLGQVPLELAGEDKRLAIATTDVLCWVLGHDHNQNFGNNLTAFELLLEEMGYELAPMEGGIKGV